MVSGLSFDMDKVDLANISSGESDLLLVTVRLRRLFRPSEILYRFTNFAAVYVN